MSVHRRPASSWENLAGLYRVEDRGSFRRELEGVAIAAGDEHGATTSLLCHRRRGEKIVGLVAGAPRIGEAAGGDKFRNQFKLLDELVVEIAAALIGRKSLVPVGLRFERIPADQHRTRLLGAIELQQAIGETEDRTRRPPAIASNRLRQRMIGAVREGIAVDHQQRTTLGSSLAPLCLTPHRALPRRGGR